MSPSFQHIIYVTNRKTLLVKQIIEQVMYQSGSNPATAPTCSIMRILSPAQLVFRTSTPDYSKYFAGGEPERPISRKSLLSLGLGGAGNPYLKRMIPKYKSTIMIATNAMSRKMIPKLPLIRHQTSAPKNSPGMNAAPIACAILFFFAFV